METFTEATFNYEWNAAANPADTLPKAVNYLSSNVAGDTEKLFTDSVALKALFFVGKMTAYENSRIDFAVFESDEFLTFLGALMSYSYENHSEFDFEFQTINIFFPEQATTLPSKRFFAFKYCMHISNQIISQSVFVGTHYPLLKGLKGHIDFLNDLNFVKTHLDSDLVMWDNVPYNVLEYLVLNISSLSRHCEDIKQKWIELDVVNVLLKLAEIKTSTAFKFDCYTTCVNIADDKQIESLSQINDSFSHLLGERLKLLSEAFVSGEFERQTRQVFENNTKINYEIISLKEVNKTSYTYLLVANSLYKLAVNNKMKETIYFNLNAKEYFKIIMTKGNVYEIKLSLKVLAQLSFNAEVLKDIAKDADYVKIIEENKTRAELDINQLCQRIEWNINEYQKKNNDASSSTSSSEEKKHVMISYNTGSRELCLKIKSSLESSGYKVWMDVSDIHGSSLDSMAKAVENSYCVLMCVTEKYRQSINCQSEAQYAYKLGRPIIPCIMQTGYENVTGISKLFDSILEYKHSTWIFN